MIPASLYAQQLQVQLSPQIKQGGYHISCAGQNNGAIQTLVVGGKPPYTYLWNDAVTNANRSTLAAGTYILTVTDSLLATVSDTVTLFEPQTLSAQTQVSSYEGGFAISSYGGTDGSLQLTVSGGTPPYTYTWSSGSSQATLSFIGAGSYSCIIEDAAGCIVNKSENLQEPPLLQASVSILQHVQCSGDGNGSATAIVSGGVGPYRFTWLSGESDSIAVQLYGGAQHVDVSDRNNVTLRLTFELNEPESFRVSEQTSLYPNGYEVSCSGCYNGSIQMNATGGTPPYSILWADSTTELQRNLLGGGKYNYNMVDALGCEISGMVILTEPQRDDWSRAGNAGIDPLTQFIGTTDSTPLTFKTNNQEVLRITEGGNIGIGTNSPEYKFEVDGNVRLKQGVKLSAIPTLPDSLSIEEQMSYKLMLLSQNGDVFSTSYTTLHTGGTLTHNCQSAAESGYLPTWRSVAGEPGILHTGFPQCKPFVGIGTQSPLANLHVNGDSRTDFKTSASKAVFGDFSTYSEGNSKVSIPAFNMPAGSSALTIDHQTGENENYRYSFVNNVNRDYTKAIVVNQSTSSQESFIVYGDGTTIIGHDPTNPITPDNNTKLAVMGLIGAREIKVTLDPFPDYVFESDYELMTWQQLAEFIKVNGHLPGVMSEKDVEKNNGVELGELTRQNLEKIEELYLYMLEMQEKLSLLQIENLRLKSLIDNM